jgi:hypothetical protein
LVIKAWTKDNTKLAAFRTPKKDCKDTILQDMLKYYRTLDNFEDIFNKQNQHLHFPTKVHINRGVQMTNLKYMVIGRTIFGHEFYKMPKSTFDQLDMRCSDTVFWITTQLWMMT